MRSDSGCWRIAAICALFAIPAIAGAQTIKTLDGSTLTPGGIDKTIESLMKANHVKGLAVALIRDGRVAYIRIFGVRNAQGAPLTPDAVMYGASLTKATFAYMVMQLVDEGKIDLSASSPITRQASPTSAGLSRMANCASIAIPAFPSTIRARGPNSRSSCWRTV